MLEEMTMKALRLVEERKPVSIVRNNGQITVGVDGHTGKEVTDALHAFDRSLERVVSCEPNGNILVRHGYNFTFVGQP